MANVSNSLINGYSKIPSFTWYVLFCFVYRLEELWECADGGSRKIECTLYVELMWPLMWNLCCNCVFS